MERKGGILKTWSCLVFTNGEKGRGLERLGEIINPQNLSIIFSPKLERFGEKGFLLSDLRLHRHRRPAPTLTTVAPAPSSAFPSAPRPPAPSLPFLSFDIGSAPAPSSFSSAPTLSSSSSSAFSPDDELPLLEELGINTRQIWRNTAAILNPLNPNPALHDNADLSGPFLHLMAFGLFQLLAGKFHFGIILGWVAVAALFLYVVFNMLAGRNGNLDLYRCLSLVGYCMIPMVIFSAASLFVPHGGVVVFAMAAVFVLWSTRACTRLLVELASCGDEHRGLIAYACWLVYMLFSLLVIF